MSRSITLFAACCLTSVSSAHQLDILEGITFYEDEAIYLPAREVGNALNWPVGWNAETSKVSLHGKEVGAVRQMSDGTRLIPLSELKGRGLEITWDSEQKLRKVRYNDQAFFVRDGQKRVVINKEEMSLSAWQGTRQVLSSPVTLGIEGHKTPTGIFEMQGYRAKMHKSSIYNNAPMPWAFQVVGNIFIHGWKDVNPGRGSHGCIRLPMTPENKARWMYYWVEKDVPISVLGKWPKGAVGAGM